MLYAGQGWADSFQQTVSAHTSEEYVTNPLLIPADHGLSAWRTTLEPAYALTDAMGANQLKASLDLLLLRSSNTNIVANRDNSTVSLDWLRTGEKGEFDISAKYNQASFLVDEPSATGIIPVDATRASRTLSANWSRALGERSTFTLNGSYTDIIFTGAGTGLTDYATQSDGIKYSYALSEHSTPFVMVSYVDFVPTHSSGPITRLYSAMLGLNWEVSERLDWMLQAGPSRYEAAGSTVGSNTTSSVSLQGGATMNYKGQAANLTLNAGRQATPSGLGGFILTNQANGSWSYDLGERSKAGIDLGWRKTDYLTGNLYRTAGAWLHRDLTSSWGMKVYYHYAVSTWGGTNLASSNMLGLSLDYTSL